MKYLAQSLALFLCLVLTGTGGTQEKGNEQILKKLAELRAEVKALRAEVAKLKGEDGKLVPTLTEYDRKWVRNMTADFMNAMLTQQYPLPAILNPPLKPFVAKGWNPSVQPDPNVMVQQKQLFLDSGYSNRGLYWIDKHNGYKGPRRVYMHWIFEKYQIESEEVNPAKDEVVVRGKLSGNKPDLLGIENWGGGRNFVKTVIEAGELGERKGTFMLRVAREKETNRWAINYLVWSVDELKKHSKKK